MTGAGAPGGIGAAVARELVAEGGRVVLGATSERVHQRAEELGDAAVGVIADLTVDGAADSLVRAALDRWGRVDVLVNNAGMTSVTAGWDTDDDVAEMSLAAWVAALARKPHDGISHVPVGAAPVRAVSAQDVTSHAISVCCTPRWTGGAGSTCW